MEPFKKSVLVGQFRLYDEKYANTFVTIDWDGRRLSIAGVEGPDNKGDCEGGCGQINKPLASDRGQPYGLSFAQIDRLWEIWERWHLNDMRPWCEHQRENPSFQPKRVEISYYTLSGNFLSEVRKLKEGIIERLANGEEVALTDGEKDFLRKRPYRTTFDANVPPEYELDKTESTYTNWLYPSKHPEGFLMKPCEVCGYKYGSRWLYEEVPEEVLQELQDFPEGDVKIPNVWA